MFRPGCFQCLIRKFFVGICLPCSLDYSGIMPRIFVLLFSRVVILYFLFSRCTYRSSEKLDRKLFFFCRSRKFHDNTGSVLFVHFPFDICNLFIRANCALFTWLNVKCLHLPSKNRVLCPYLQVRIVLWLLSSIVLLPGCLENKDPLRPWRPQNLKRKTPFYILVLSLYFISLKSFFYIILHSILNSLIPHNRGFSWWHTPARLINSALLIHKLFHSGVSVSITFFWIQKYNTIVLQFLIFQ